MTNSRLIRSKTPELVLSGTEKAQREPSTVIDIHGGMLW